MDMFSSSPAVSRIKSCLRLRGRSHDNDDGVFPVFCCRACVLRSSGGAGCGAFRCPRVLSGTAGHGTYHGGCRQSCQHCFYCSFFHEFIPFSVLKPCAMTHFYSRHECKKIPERSIHSVCVNLPGIVLSILFMICMSSRSDDVQIRIFLSCSVCKPPWAGSFPSMGFSRIIVTL